ncbi:MAG: hypothetical protein ACYCXA_13775, partial [Actinomycetes bacterium]
MLHVDETPDRVAGCTHLVNAVHVWCGAHLVRDLHGVCAADPDRQLWAKAMVDTLLDTNTAAQTAQAVGAPAIESTRLATIRNHPTGVVRVRSCGSGRWGPG